MGFINCFLAGFSSCQPWFLPMFVDYSCFSRNRVRTKGLVAIFDQNKLNEIENKRLQLTHIPVNSPALQRIQKEAYFHHIHHTVAIEGNTMSLQEIRVILETGRCIGGKIDEQTFDS